MADLPAREAMEFDVVIVGAGPAGLSSAIRIKQINPDISVVIVEKGSEVGAHILSGAVIDPVGLDKLLPEWRSEDTPIKTAVTDDRFYFLGQTGALRLPNFTMPPLKCSTTTTARSRALPPATWASARTRNRTPVSRAPSANSVYLARNSM